VNAGGLPDELLDAELFGAEAGAFTGAKKLRVGRFEEATGGTLFLDEIGNLSTAGQMKLLRVLQTGEFQRLGSNQTRRSDVRVISATNADLLRAIESRRFREDLYFRLNVIELAVPPLRDRVEDIEPLANHFLRIHATESEGRMGLGRDAIQAMVDHDWPGNVRELENRIQRAALVCRGPTLTATDLGLVRPSRTSRDSTPPSAENEHREVEGDGEHPPRQDERAYLEGALIAAGGVVSKAAAELGLSRQAFYRRMERMGIELERRPKR
jgi:DNA-binding NtrC family response regulator